MVNKKYSPRQTEEIEDAEVSNVSDIIGPWGPWQRNIFVFFFIGAMCSCWHSLGLSFYAPNIEFWCKKPESYQNASADRWYNASTNKCQHFDNISAKCEAWEYDLSFYQSTIISEWNLVCSRAALVSATQSAYMMGVMVTVIVMGQLADKLGRRPIIWIGLIIELIAGLSCAFSVSIEHFMFSRFWLAFGASARWGTGFVLLLETVGPQYRALVGMAIEFGWAFGYIILPGVAYFLRDFRLLQLSCTLPEFVLLLWWWTLPESPRWQLTHGKFDDAEKALMKAAEINGKTCDECKIDDKLKKLLEKTEAEQMIERTNRKYNFFDLFKTRKIATNTFILYFSWFVNAFVYYGLSLNTNNLGGNPYINFLLAGAVEFPAYAICIYILKKFGRRMPLAMAMFGGGIGCLATIPFMNDKFTWIKITFAMFGKFCVTCSFGIIYVYSAEIYPTVVRSVGVGSSSMVGRFGSILAPFVKELGNLTHMAVPLVLFGTISVADGILVLFLPETHEKEMPDTITQAENFNRSPKESESKSDSIRKSPTSSLLSSDIKNL